MKMSRKLALAVSSVAVVMSASWVSAQTIIDRNSAAANLNTVGAWTGGVIPGAANIAQWTTGSATANTLGANLTFGGLRVLSPAGSVVMTGNTLTLGAFGINMSSATQDLRIDSALALTGSVKQTWNIADGRTLTYTGAMFASNTSAGSVLLSNTGAIFFTNANVAPNVLLGANPAPQVTNTNGNFVINGGRDFVGTDANRRAVAGQIAAPASYGANPLTPAALPVVGATIPTVFNMVNFNADAPNGVTGLKANTGNIFPNGWLFNTPVAAQNPNNLDWVVDATGVDANGNPTNRQLGGGALGILMGPDADTNVRFIHSGTGAQGGFGFRLGNRLAFWHVRNYNTTKDLTIAVQISQAAGGGVNSSIVKSGPGRVNLNNAIFLNASGGVIVQEGTLQFLSTGSIASPTGTITVGGGTLLLNNTSPTAIAPPTVVNSGGSLGGTGSAVGAVTLNSGSSYSPGATLPEVGIQTLTTLVTNSGTSLRWDFADATTYDQVTVSATGGLNLGAGGTGSIPISLFGPGNSMWSTEGTYTLFRLTGGLGGSGLATNLTVTNADPSKTYIFGSSASALTLTISGSAPTPIFWTRDSNGGVWGDNANWSAAFPDGAGRIASFGGGSVTFTGARTVTLGANRTVGQLSMTAPVDFTIAAAGSESLLLDNQVSAAAVTASGGNHTISAPVVLTADGGATMNVESSLTISGVVTGNGSIAKVGAGTLTLSADSNQLGNVNVGNGTLALAGTSNTLTALNITGGTAVIAKTGNTIPSANVSAGTLRIGDGVSDGTLPGTLSVTGAGVLEFNRGTDLNTNGPVAGVTSGTLSFAGPATYRLQTFGNNVIGTAGTVRVNGARVIIDDGNAIYGGSAPFIGGLGGQPLQIISGTLDLNANNVNAGVISGPGGTITDTSTNNGVSLLTYNSSADGTFAGTIVEGPGQKIALQKISPNTANSIGIWTLSGSNNFSGGVTVGKGDLVVANANALGTGDVTVTAAGTNASARARVLISDSYTLNNNFTVNGLNTDTQGAILVNNANATVTLTGSIKQNAGAIGAGTTPGGTVAGPNGTGILVIAGPILASDDGLAYPFVVNASSQGNVRFAFPGGGPVGATTGQVIINSGNISLGAVDGVPAAAELVLGNLGSGQTTFNLNGYDQTLRRLTRGAGSGTATLTNTSAVRSIVTLNTDADNTFSGGVAGNTSINHAGTHTVSLTGAVTLTGDLSVTGTDGRLVIANAKTVAGGALNVTGTNASVLLTANRAATYTRVGNFSSINIGSTGVVTVPATARATNVATGVISTGTISVAAGGFLDLGNNDLVVTNGVSQLASIRAAVAAWYNGGTPALTGIGATSADPAVAFTTLAVFSNATDTAGSPFYATYDGVGINDAAVIVKFAYIGDTNIDGVLDIKDAMNILEGLSTGGTGWNAGDFNYDGAVTAADYGLFLAAQTAIGSGSLGGGQGLSEGGSGAIPEPGTASLLLAAAPMLTRRRRNRA